MRAAIACLLVLLPVAPAGAADIYRWVDENGKVHMSDVVPEKYRKSAKRIGSPSEVSPAQREEAEARAAADRARATAAAEKAAPAASPAAQAKPAARAETDCEKAHRIYKESLDCFARYTTVRGATRAEAFNHCTAMPDPSHRCGPAPNW
jgi:hypothetical protein